MPHIQLFYLLLILLSTICSQILSYPSLFVQSYRVAAHCATITPRKLFVDKKHIVKRIGKLHPQEEKQMNVLYVLATAVTVSIDSFFAGFSLSLNKRNNLTLPLTVALVTYVLCLAASFAGVLLRDFLQNYVKYAGALIMLVLGVANLVKKENEALRDVSFLQCFAIGVSVGFDGATATLSLVIQNIGDVVFTPVLVATTHFFTVWAGQHLAQYTKLQKANVFAAVMFFVLASIKLFEL